MSSQLFARLARPHSLRALQYALCVVIAVLPSCESGSNKRSASSTSTLSASKPEAAASVRNSTDERYNAAPQPQGPTYKAADSVYLNPPLQAQTIPEALASYPPPGSQQVRLSDDAWRSRLTDKEFEILRSDGTERAFSGELLRNKQHGIYTCAACGNPLFSSETKFRSGTGWPSFWAPIDEERVTQHVDSSFGMLRTETVCGRCGGHLGHIFEDGPKPTGLRYCINSVALDFVPIPAVDSTGPVKTQTPSSP